MNSPGIGYISFWLVLVFVQLPMQQSNAGEIGVNIFGISYHPDGEDSEGNKLNGWNPGVGLNWIVRETPRSIFHLEGGLYTDSRKDLSEYVAGGYRFKIVEAVSIGAGVFLVHSSAYNGGRPVVAPLPMLCVRNKKVSGTIIYAPRYKDVNRNSVYAFYATFYFGD